MEAAFVKLCSFALTLRFFLFFFKLLFLFFFPGLSAVLHDIPNYPRWSVCKHIPPPSQARVSRELLLLLLLLFT